MVSRVSTWVGGEEGWRTVEIPAGAEHGDFAPPEETQEAEQVVAGDELDAFKLALELQLDLIEARELLEIAIELVVRTDALIYGKEFLDMTRSFLDRTK